MKGFECKEQDFEFEQESIHVITYVKCVRCVLTYSSND